MSESEVLFEIALDEKGNLILKSITGQKKWELPTSNDFANALLKELMATSVDKEIKEMVRINWKAIITKLRREAENRQIKKA